MGVSRKQNTPNFQKNEHIRFPENMPYFVSLKHLFWDSLLDFCEAYSSGLHLGNWFVCAIVEDEKEAFVS